MSGKSIREWSGFIGSILATVLSVAAFVGTQRNTAATNRIDADRLLAEAWDLLGGRPGTNEIVEYVKTPEQLELASRKIDEAKMFAPKYGKVYWIEASLAIARGQYDEAVTLSRKAIRYDPTAAAPHNRIGQVRLMQKRWSEAADAFRAAIALKPNDAILHSNRCWALINANDLAEAGKECQEAIRIRPQFKQAWANLWILRKKQGNSAEAESANAMWQKLDDAEKAAPPSPNGSWTR